MDQAIVVMNGGRALWVAFGWRAALQCARGCRRSTWCRVGVRGATVPDLASYETGLPRLPRWRFAS